MSLSSTSNVEDIRNISTIPTIPVANKDAMNRSLQEEKYLTDERVFLTKLALLSFLERSTLI